jgi:HTH-type transcriptional regulator / antitoxin HigA
MEPRVIGSRTEYEDAVSEVRRLLEANPPSGSPDADRLRLLALVVETYEREHFPIEAPSPLEAIRFRMAEQGLTQRDLEPFIGSKSKVSEVLSGKTRLTLRMIRGLHHGLGIPAGVLLGEGAGVDSTAEQKLDWTRFPLREMARRGWLTARARGEAALETAARAFFAQVEGEEILSVTWRRTLAARTGAATDPYALLAWIARIVIRSKDLVLPASYRAGSVTTDILRAVSRLSARTDGPRAALEMLAQKGIPVVVEPYLPGTRVDGAAVFLGDGTPIIGLTVRYDRLDSFWFTLLHELAHVSLHGTSSRDIFVDDLDIDPGAHEDEVKADQLASETFIPRSLWVRSPAFKKRTSEAVLSFANSLGISPAIVAGRLRHDIGNHRVLNSLMGHKQVRLLFPEVSWD